MRNSSLIRKFVLVSALLGVPGLSALGEDKAAEVAEKAAVSAVMRKNFEALMNLQQYAASPEKFSDPANRGEIQKNLDAMSGLKHVFPKQMANEEPGLAAISTMFSEYLQDIQKAFKSGSSGNFVRNRVRTMTGFCLSCHTRVSSDKNFEDVNKRVASMELTPFQRAEFFAATRQFDKALEAFEKIISTVPEGEFALLEFGHSVRNMLSITIRVKQDPKATYFLLEKLAGRKDVPEYFQRYIAQWKRDVAEWMKERKAAKSESAQALMTRATRLMDRAAKAQLFAVDPAGDVSYLRATNYLHEALQKDPKGKFRGEALYRLGICYDSLHDPLLWALDSLYFEACVREFPHTEVSKKCYKRYATKLYFGYSGSGGTFVPEDELEKLGELRKLAE